MSDHNWITNTIQGNPRYGQQYYVTVKPDSHGNPGKWHTYKDGTKMFLADNQTGGTAYTSPTVMGGMTGSMAAPAPAPAPAAPAPAPAAPPVDTTIPHPHVTHVGLGSAEARRDYFQRNPWGVPVHTNNINGSQHFGEKYIVDTMVDANNNIGIAHIYEDGSKEFLDQAQGSSEKPYYQTNNDPNSSHYGQVFYTTTGDNNNGDLVDYHIYNNSAHDGGESDFVVVPHNDASSRSAVKASSPDGTNTHTVVAGDTLSGIAAANGMELNDIVALNPQIQDPNLIHPGEQVNLGESRPVAGAVVSPDAGAAFPTTSTYGTPNPATANQLDDKTVEKIAGWANVAGEVATDPVKGVIDAASRVQTDPLKIDDGKKNT